MVLAFFLWLSLVTTNRRLRCKNCLASPLPRVLCYPAAAAPALTPTLSPQTRLAAQPPILVLVPAARVRAQARNRASGDVQTGWTAAFPGQRGNSCSRKGD